MIRAASCSTARRSARAEAPGTATPAITPMIASTASSSKTVAPRRMGARWGLASQPASSFCGERCCIPAAISYQPSAISQASPLPASRFPLPACCLPVASCLLPVYFAGLPPELAVQWILLVVLVVVALWVMGAYNALISLKNQVVNAWKQIDVQLKRRHDLIPNLVNTVKGAMDFERSTLDAVISARNKAVSAQGVAATAKAEGELTQALGRLFALTEAYPDLKSSQNVLQLQEELTSTENKIGFARQLYNDVATQYNTKQMQFPTNLVAGLAKASPADLWEIEDAAERAVPKVDLSLNKPTA